MAKDVEVMAERRDRLYARLEKGYARIEEKLRDGSDVTGLEDFWIQLLGEYENVCTELQRELAAPDEAGGRLVQHRIGGIR